MDVKLSASISLDALPIECPDLHRRMAEVLALREKVASLEHGGKKLDERRRKANFVLLSADGVRRYDEPSQAR